MREIIPGQAIDNFQLSWTYPELLAQLKDKEYQIEDLQNNNLIIHYLYYKFWIDTQSDAITQIGVYDGYDGKLNGLIGIGSTLTDVKQCFGAWQEDLYVYIIPTIPGVCFELADNDIDDEWIQETAPIGAIYIFK